MYLKCRLAGVYFLILLIAFPSCSLSYGTVQKMRVSNVEDYGERLSSIERGRRDSDVSSGENDENKGILKLSAVSLKDQEDSAQEDGMSLQADQGVKTQEQKSSSKQVLSKEEDKVNPEDKSISQNNVSPEDKSISQNNVSPEDKSISQNKDSPEEKFISFKNINQEEEFINQNNVSPEEKSEDENDGSRNYENKVITLSNPKQKIDKVNEDVESSTKCTTDREITIGDYTPPQHSQSHDDLDGGGDNGGDDAGGGDDDAYDGGDDGGDGDGHGGGGGKGEVEPEKKVSKVYKGPKPAKAPDHYIDDI